MTQHTTTLGFEIEYLRGANIDTVLGNIRTLGSENGKPALANVADERSRYNTTFYTDRWVQAYDCSCGWEIKSQPLTDTEEVKLVMQGIRAAGGRVNASCGLHVHMDVRSLTHQQRCTLVKLYARYEKAMDTLLPRSRRGRTSYASSLHSVTPIGESFFAAIDNADSHYRLTQVAQRIGRYSKLNLQCFESKGTFEFRGHQGTLNFKKIDAWASILGALYNACQQVTEVVAEYATLDQLIDELLPYAPGVQAQRAVQSARPRTGTKAATIFDLCETIAANDNGTFFVERNGRRQIKNHRDLYGFLAAETGFTPGYCRNVSWNFLLANDLGRATATSHEALGSYLRRRAATLAAR